MLRRLPILVAVFLLAGCAAGANFGAGAEARRVQTVDLPAPPAEAFRTTAQAAASGGWQILTSDAATGVVTAKTPGTGGRWADDVSLIVTPAGSGSTVTARSGLANGPNITFVRAFLDSLRQP